MNDLKPGTRSLCTDESIIAARISPERIDAWFQMNIRFVGPIHNNLATGMAEQIARFS